MKKKLISNFINGLLKFFNIYIIFRKGNALGDQLLISGVVRLIKKKNQNLKIVLFVTHSVLFFNNPNIYKVFKLDETKFINKIIYFILKNLTGHHLNEFLPQKKNLNNKVFAYFYNRNMHLAQMHCDHFNFNLNFYNFKNEFFFSEGEVKTFKKSITLPKKFSIIQSTSKKTFTTNKEWKINGMQSIVDKFPNINWVQVGKNNEPKLKNCIYLDLNLRELAYVISKCNFIVTYEGFLNHLASCFNKKTFVIHTGFLTYNFFKYKNNTIIENNKKIQCFPCYNLNCKKHRNYVLKNITTSFVLDKLSKLIKNKN